MLTGNINKDWRYILGAIIVLSVARLAVAHHSAAVVYDLDTEIVHAEATILGWRFVNPHAQLIYQVTGPDGKPVEWVASTGNLIALRRNGVEADSFIPGQILTVSGNPARDGSPTLEAHHVELMDGTTIALIPSSINASATPAAVAPEAESKGSDNDAGSGLGGGAWKFVPGPLPDEVKALAPEGIILMDAYGQAPELSPGESATYPLTEKGRKFQQGWQLSGNECTPVSPWLEAVAPYLIELEEERSGRIHMQYEYMDQERTIWLDGRDHPSTNRIPRSLQGHSTGHWEGDTLVVEITNMLANQVTRNGIYHSDQAVITEKYSRNGNRLVIVRVLEDPEHFTRPIAEVLMRQFEPGGEVFVYGECEPQVPGSSG
jgi:hypothetical protein